MRRACGSGVRFVENPAFAATNSLYSLWLARAVLTEGFVVINCDVLFHPAHAGDLLTARHENALLVSYPTSARSAVRRRGDEGPCPARRVVAIGEGSRIGRGRR